MALISNHEGTNNTTSLPMDSASAECDRSDTIGTKCLTKQNPHPKPRHKPQLSCSAWLNLWRECREPARNCEMLAEWLDGFVGMYKHWDHIFCFSRCFLELWVMFRLFRSSHLEWTMTWMWTWQWWMINDHEDDHHIAWFFFQTHSLRPYQLLQSDPLIPQMEVT